MTSVAMRQPTARPAALAWLAGPLFVIGLCSFAAGWPGRVFEAAALVALVVLSIHGSSVVRFRLPASVVAWLVLVVLSRQWSALPASTAQASRTALLAFVISMAVAFLMRREPMRSLESLRLSTLALTLVSLGAVITATEQSPDGWKGIFVHKNWCGFVAAICVLVALDWLRARRSLQSWFAMCAALVLLVGSQSVTAIIAAAISAIAVQVVGRRGDVGRKLSPGRGLAVSAGLIALLIGISYRSALLRLFGRDPDLTGRTDLWAATLPSVSERLWLGWGYYGFWDPGQARTLEIWRRIGWTAPSAHSAYLDTLLQLGVVGLLVLAALCGRFIVASSLSSGAATPLAVGLGAAVLVQGVSERGPLSSTGLFVFLVAVLYLCQSEYSPDGARPASESVPIADGYLAAVGSPQLHRSGLRRGACE